MNENHAKLCPSPEWAGYLQTEVLPAVTAGIGLGDHLLEVGPGPGAATDWLRDRVGQLTAIELDPVAAQKLAAKYAGSNVEISRGDATAMRFADATFDSAATCTMLHHVPTAAGQNRVLAEVFRVLRPGGVLFGSDSLASEGLHHFHVDDVYNPVEPAAFLTRLQTIGFVKITITVDDIVMFVAHKPEAIND